MYGRTKLSPILIFIAFFLAFAATAMELKVSVQPENLTVGKYGKLTISARDASNLRLAERPGDVPGIKWESGVSTGSSVSVVNGARSSEASVTIPFTATREGEITIPSIEVIVTGDDSVQEKTKTEPVTFKIVAAAAMELKASVQPENLTVGKYGKLTISARDASNLRLAERPGDVPGIKWESGVSTGSSVSVVNGARSSEASVTIPFTATREGEITIPSIEVIVTGDDNRMKMKTAPVTFKIAAAKDSPAAQDPAASKPGEKD